MESPSDIKLLLQRLLKGNKVNKFQRTLQEKAKNGSQMLEEIKKLLGPPSTADPTTMTRPSHEKVFGRDEDSRDIIKMLREASNHSVIGICGAAKFGKTTLAQCVCEYEEKQSSYFSLVIWIDVSRCFNMDEIYRQMLEAASMGQQCPNLRNHETLHKLLDAQLRGKRFLMVLDGMQKAAEDKQDELLARLNTGTEGSKIIVTTWSEQVAVSLGATSLVKIRELKLNEKDFSDLFVHYALPGDGHKSDTQILQKLQETGADIAKQLGRSPMVAREMGEQLRLYPNLDPPIIREAVVRYQETIREELRRSYRHLDQPVRLCFAYCSLFPPMQKFKPHALAQLWMAQGFIEREDTAIVYLHKLMSLSFMQSGGKPDYVWYTIPDEVMQQLAEEAAGTECLRVEGFHAEYKVKTSSPSHVRHLFITPENAMRFKSHIYKMKKLRTLIIRDVDGHGGSGITVQVLERLLKELKKLRALQVYLEAYKLMMPQSVCGLKHLRFLSISGTNLKQVKLPKQFGKLYYLQTIHIECRQFPGSCHLDISKVKNWSNLKNLQHMPHLIMEREDSNKSPQERSHSKLD